MKSIWKEIGESFDNSIARLTAVYIKESDDTCAFFYPGGENKLSYYYDKSVKSIYDQPPRLKFDFFAMEYPSICGSIGSNRALFSSQKYYPSLIERKYDFMNLAVFGTESLSRAVEGSVTWSMDMTCRTEGQRFTKSIFSVVSSDSLFRVKDKSGTLALTEGDVTLYIASNNAFEYGLYSDENKTKRELRENKLSRSASGHYLVIRQSFDLGQYEKARLCFGISEKDCTTAQKAASVTGEAKIVEKRENRWFDTLPKLDFTSAAERRAYYKSWLTIKNNYYNHPKWGHCITESLPVYKGIWQWAIPSVEWHSEQNPDHTSEWIKKAMDMLLDNQRTDGYVTHAIYIDEDVPGERWGGTSTIQTPHLPWVAVRYYRATGDIDSIKKWLPSLKKYYEYLNSSRDECYRKLHLWAITTSFDTGLDTTSVFQRVTYGDEKGKESYCYPAIMAAERARYEVSLAELCDIVGEDAGGYLAESKKTVDAMNRYLWDAGKNWYGVIHEDGELDTRVGVDGLFALAYGLVDEDRARLMKKPFSSLVGKYGVRTVAEGEKGFRADVYWRGACWPKSCSVGIAAAKLYYPELADEVYGGILRFVLKYPNIWECINVSTGELARSDHGFVCTPGMTSNVGAGDIIGSILMYHGFGMYDLDMAVPCVPMTDFHHAGLRITVFEENGEMYASCKACEKKSAEVKFAVKGKVRKIRLCENEKVKLI